MQSVLKYISAGENRIAQRNCLHITLSGEGETALYLTYVFMSKTLISACIG